MNLGNPSAEVSLDQFGTLPRLPPLAMAVLPLLNDVETTAEDLANALSVDPVLTATLLRLVNSSQFGLHEEVRSLATAIQYLGFMQVRALTIASVTGGLRRCLTSRYAAEGEQLWLHALDVGSAAKRLAERVGLHWSEEAFVAGVLHDCGRMVMLHQAPAKYATLMRADRCLPECAVERRAFGIDHTVVGAALMRHWRMPEQLIVSCSSHHGAIETDAPHAELLTLVALADRFQSKAPFDDIQRNADAVGLSGMDLAELAEGLGHEVGLDRELLADL